MRKTSTRKSFAKRGKIILNENIYKADAAHYTANKTGAAVVISPISVGGVEQAKDYFSLMNTIVKKIEEGFQL